MDYSIGSLSRNNQSAMAQVEKLLRHEGIALDRNLDYTCAVYDEDYQIVATGSFYGNTLRCIAVDSAHQGEGLLNTVVSHLTQELFSRGERRLFVYTKISSAGFFEGAGFREVARVSGKLVFMENCWNGFSDYLRTLEATRRPGRAAALVMNANPFTLGHLYLVQKAAGEWDTLHLFLVSEDKSFFPFSLRRQLVMEGTAHIPNIVYHATGPYIISNATFPSYFLKDEEEVIRSHAQLDVSIFASIACALSIQKRYVGEEPYSRVTSLYNQVLSEQLPTTGIACAVIPRMMISGQPISASSVRQALKEGDWKAVASMVPASTLARLSGPEGRAVIEKLRSTANVWHD